MRTRSRFVALLVALSLMPVTAGGQGRASSPPASASVPGQSQKPPAIGSGAISGVVIDGSTGAPVPGAVVMLATIVGLTVPSTLQSPANAPPPPPTRQIADGKGRFAFVNLPAAPSYTLKVSKPGYLDGGYGSDKSATDVLREIAVKDGEWVSNINVPIWRPGAISGTIRDERGEPVVGVYVRAYMRASISGRDELVAGPVVTTDDRGAYRITGLSPARYLIAVPSVQASTPASLPFKPNPAPSALDGALDIEGTTTRLFIGRYPLPPPPVKGRRFVYPIMFHPSTSAVAQATAIDLKFGDDRGGVDITLEPVPTVRVSGVVEGPPDALKNLTLRLLPIGLENLGLGSETATSLVDENGTFTFVNVPGGSYVLDAPRSIGEYRSNAMNLGIPMDNVPSRQSGWSMNNTSTDTPGVSFGVTDLRSGAANYSARMSLTVGNADLANVVVTLRAQSSLSGYTIMEKDPSKPPLPNTSRFILTADPASGSASLGMPRSIVDPDDPADEFFIPGLGPAEYWLRVVSPSGWLPKSIRWKGRDYVDAPFDATSGNISGIEVTVTNALPTLSGTLRQTNGAPITSATSVLLFPANRAQWVNAGIQPMRFRATSGTGAGTYKMTNAPAGEYFVVAVPGPPGGWRAPEFLQKLERVATRVTLNWGTGTSQDLVVREVK